MAATRATAKSSSSKSDDDTRPVPGADDTRPAPGSDDSQIPRAACHVENARTCPERLARHKLLGGKRRRPVAPGANITGAGADIGRGETVLRRGDLLTSRETGVLAALGGALIGIAPMYEPVAAKPKRTRKRISLSRRPGSS